MSAECRILEETRVYGIMSSPPVWVRPEAGLEEAAKRMYEAGVGSVLVLGEDSVLLGILTRRDLIYLLASGVARKNPPVRLYMKESVITAREGDTVRQALDRMRSAGVRHLAVLDSEGKPVGVVSMWDILMLLARKCIGPGW